MTVPPRPDVALIEGYHSPQHDVAVRLNTNEAPEPPPAAFIEGATALLRALSLNRYPDREATALREGLAGEHGLSPSQVFCANGSNEILQCLLLAYGGPGRTVAVFEPTYALHGHIAKVTGTGVVVGERDEDYFIGAAELARVLSVGAELGEPNPVITFVCSPNNPTGRLEPEDRLLAVLEAAPGLVVVDEAYGQFAPRSAIELLGAYPNLVVVRTFSKTWSLAGLRLGYALAGPDVIEAMAAVALPYHLDAAKQALGCLALGFGDEMAARVGRLVAERTRLVAGLTHLGAVVVPSDANFVLFEVPDREATSLWQGLLDVSVLVRDVSSWPRLGRFLRVTVGTPEEDDAFLDALGALCV